MKLIPLLLVILFFSCGEQSERIVPENAVAIEKEETDTVIETLEMDTISSRIIYHYVQEQMSWDSTLTLSIRLNNVDQDSVKHYSVGYNNTNRFEGKYSFIENTKSEIFNIDHFTADTIQIYPKIKKRVTLVPCSNGYLYMSQGICVNDDLHELLLTSELNYIDFPFVKMQGSGYSGIYTFSDSKRIRDKTDFDVLILTRMYGSEYGVEELGYTIKLIDVKSQKEIKSIGKKVISSDYDEVVKHLKNNLAELIDDIEGI